jgi:hypothetical protein
MFRKILALIRNNADTLDEIAKTQGVGLGPSDPTRVAPTAALKCAAVVYLRTLALAGR